MMSEKRLASSGDSFVDLTQMETVDLLNKLSDENTRLHKKVDEQQATISQLKEENEQLKHYKLYEDNKRLQTIIADLKEENEQLKNKLNGSI